MLLQFLIDYCNYFRSGVHRKLCNCLFFSGFILFLLIEDGSVYNHWIYDVFMRNLVKTMGDGLFLGTFIEIGCYYYGDKLDFDADFKKV